MKVSISDSNVRAACARAGSVGTRVAPCLGALLLGLWLDIAGARAQPLADAGVQRLAPDASVEASSAHADAGSAGVMPGEPVQVVVTGSRNDELQRNSAVATQVITRQQIEQSGARNAGELLANQPALQVQENFRGTELWLRGLDPEYTLILIDGERVPGRVGGAIDLSRFGVERIERVEIVRGPSSALYGSDAIAGVVNLVARESKRPLEGDALLDYGSRNTLDATGYVAGQVHETSRLSATGGYHQTDAFRRGDSEATSGSARQQWSAGGTARFDANQKHRLLVAGDYLRLNLTGVDQGAANALIDREQLQEQLSLRASQRYTPSRRWRWENRAAYGQFRDQYLLDQRGGTALDSYEENKEQLATFSSLLRYARSLWSTTVGVDLMLQRLSSPRLSDTGQRERGAVYNQFDVKIWQRGERAVRLVPGLRFDLDSQFGYQFSPKLALRIDPHRTVVLRLSYGRGFQAPSFQQLLLRFENPGVGYVVLGNPDLKAERSHGFDVDVEWRPAPWAALFLALYRNDLRQMITTVASEQDAAGTVFTYDNLSSAWTMGLESAVRLNQGEWITFQGSYALNYGRDNEHNRVLQGPARHRPTLWLRLAQPRWKLSGLVRGSVEIGRRFYVDEDGDGSDDLQKPPSLWRLDARVEQRIGDHVELFVGIDNLADASDEFTNLKPRTYYGGARGRY
ncbi:MAG TPA: TonB-dependent receptor [Polyangiales bacterium]